MHHPRRKYTKAIIRDRLLELNAISRIEKDIKQEHTGQQSHAKEFRGLKMKQIASVQTAPTDRSQDSNIRVGPSTDRNLYNFGDLIVIANVPKYSISLFFPSNTCLALVGYRNALCYFILFPQGNL